MHSNFLKNEKVNIFGVDLINADFKEISEIIENNLRMGEKTFIATPNTEIIMECKDDEKKKNLINSFDIVVSDGIGLVYASKIRKKPLKERVTGADLSNFLIELANREGYSIYLLGGKEGIADKASERILKKYPNIKIAGTHNGYFKEDSEVLSRIKADILFAGMGFPKQEFFMYNNRENLDVKIAIGNGGMLNIYAGEQKRAPEIFQKLGLEWFYRLLKEPSRIKRQWKLPLFLIKVLMDKNSVR